MDGYKALAAAIIGQAIEDKQNGDRHQRRDAEHFLNGKWFDTLCEYIGTTGADVRNALRVKTVCVPDEIF